ncbi:Carboxymuconolactone decarboxylase [Tolumonas auensis DSM 9187]|uniref:Carboxymuconolactone decarboxylase n=1 Tax=Tolumonas auensis (strain DSM 9187 / NBRC 110442 / TA 4) TaxID=595494 RepID=C4LED1_TOLAT|nr:carboxymuconolactone decarboxylase family protein [Tolumonas auensis]ACQ92948.1 Carboxymuconolactone decarboxylase [Tolumonas auensis DSM 9187]
MKPLAIPLLFLTVSAGFSAFAAQQTNTGENKKMDSVVIPVTSESDRPVRIADPAHFTGKAIVAPLFPAEAPSEATAAYVTFEPGARTDWHSHPVGQHLAVTRGSGYIQFWGGERKKIGQGDVVWIPPGIKHWHGATPDNSFTHLAVQEHLAGKTADWMEKVTDEQYGMPKQLPASPAQPSRAQQLMGETAPKLAELTDQVLYNDIWERPELSKRERSLITVSALIALNRPDQLRSHMSLALKNGVTQSELSEAITHLAFYTGWPSAVTAVGIAKDVFKADQKQ